MDMKSLDIARGVKIGGLAQKRICLKCMTFTMVRRKYFFGALKRSMVNCELADNEDELSNNNKRAITGHESHMDKMAEVECIEEKLWEKHEGLHSEEQIRCWAHLLQMKKHMSFDVAPNKPFWKVSGVKVKVTMVAAQPQCHQVRG